MAVLSQETREQVRKELEVLENRVKLVVFTQEIECALCRDNVSFITEIGSLSERVEVEVCNFQSEKDRRDHYGIDKIPAIAVEGVKDYGIRFYGVPAGYEFMSFLEAMRGVSTGESGLGLDTKRRLMTLRTPVHIQVFVTLTCPYCPQAVALAHKFAIEGDLIRSDMVDSAEFPHLAHRYDVFAVPQVVVNEDIRFNGALPEAEFLDKVMKAAEGPGPPGER